MFGLGTGEILIIFAAALIFIGPKKLPELAKGLGKGIREFQKAKDDFLDDDDDDVEPKKVASETELDDSKEIAQKNKDS